MYHYVFEATTKDGVTHRVDTEDSFVMGVGYHLENGDHVILQQIDSVEGSVVYFDDINRVGNLWMIFVVFLIVALLVGLLRGFLSVLSLIITVVILLAWLLPAILQGHDPVITTVIASTVVLAVNMHLSHGFNKRTFLAFLSTLVGLFFVVFFTEVFVSLAHLSGLASEEGTLLFLELGRIHLPVNILTAGIILGAMGVLDDVAITQAQTVHELIRVNNSLTRQQLFRQAMYIGRHHIASTVNTLVLVYVGAALPSILLYLQLMHGWHTFLNNELIAEEIVRTLAGTCALVLTIPISAWFATFQYRKVDNLQKST